jgi:hypothetical protein
VEDALAYALGKTSAEVTDAEMRDFLRAAEQTQDAAFRSAADRLLRETQMRVDGSPAVLELRESPNSARLREWASPEANRSFPCTMRVVLTTSLPTDCRVMVVGVPAVLGKVLLAVDRPGLERIILPLDPAEMSSNIDVSMVGAQRADASTGAAASQAPDSGNSRAAREGLAAEPGAWSVAWRYGRLGFRHIVPEGTDHALFVLGLFLLTPRVKALLWQISAFTLAHSVTLSLATLRLVSVPTSVVEPVIALSIACVAIENLFATRGHAWRPLVAFAFGLVHGLGFASGLVEIGLPTRQLVTGLVAFNVGVEGGHVAVLAVAFALLGWARSRTWYRARVVLPLSLLIAGVALFWSVDRLLGQRGTTAPGAVQTVPAGGQRVWLQCCSSRGSCVEECKHE